jgi:hypothetical protein
MHGNMNVKFPYKPSWREQQQRYLYQMKVSGQLYKLTARAVTGVSPQGN